MTSSRSTDESGDEGRGYADDVAASSSSFGFSSTSPSNYPNRREVVYEDVEFNVDNSRVWSSLIPPPAVQGYDWAPHEVQSYLPYFITTASIRHLLERVDLLADLRDVDDYFLVVLFERTGLSWSGGIRVRFLLRIHNFIS